MPKPITPFLVPLVPSAMVIIIFYFIVHLMSFLDVLFMLLLGFLTAGVPLLIIGIKIVPTYKRAIVFRMGRIVGVFGPGIIIIDPILDRVYLVDMRAKTLELVLKNVSMLDVNVRRIIAKVAYRVVDPQKALGLIYYKKKLLREAERMIREELSQVTLDEFTSEKSSIVKRILSKLNKTFIDEGIEILLVELKKE